MASNALRIDTDDFISPGLECIKEPETTPQGQKVEISLDDCLACSGCITSAEEIMLQQHNIDEIINFLDEKQSLAVSSESLPIVVAGISSQSLASICVESNCSVEIFMKKVQKILKTSGVDYIFDYSWATAIALESTFKSFKEKLLLNSNTNNNPLICSACPGWVVYAEKEHGQLITPLLSKTKSPQQILGRYIKKIFLENQSDQIDLAIENDRMDTTTVEATTRKIYHFSVMPCFDKKLEAARKANRISLESGDDPEVDVVISTVEFKNLLEKLEAKMQLQNLASTNEMSENNESNNNFFDSLPLPSSTLNSQKLPKVPLPNKSLGQFYGADSYLNYIYRRLEDEHNLNHVGEIKFSKYRGRNKDFNICELEVGTPGTPKNKYKFAAVYGFKSIQNLIRLLKTKKCDFDYIEIMACPSGCLNGGGQVRYTGVTRDVQLGKLEEIERFFIDSGLLCWPGMSASPDGSLLAKLENESFITEFSDPHKNQEVKAATGQNLIQLGSNW